MTSHVWMSIPSAVSKTDIGLPVTNPYTQNAISLQKRAPNAHTVLEIVNARWGPGARLVCP